MRAEAAEALEDSARHHQASKTFSGALALYHRAAIKTLITELGVTSILDFGCGKGLQYEGPDSLEVFWGVPVTKYDPAWPPFAEMPKGKFDLVICTHTLCWIPTADLADTVVRLCGHAAKAVYIGEMLGPTKKDFARHPERFPRGWTRRQWERLIYWDAFSGIQIFLSTLDAGDPSRKLTTSSLPVTIA